MSAGLRTRRQVAASIYGLHDAHRQRAVRRLPTEPWAGPYRPAGRVVRLLRRLKFLSKEN